MSNPVPIPIRDRLVRARDPRIVAHRVDVNEGLISLVWTEYISSISNLAQAATGVVGELALTGQSATIASTSIPASTLLDGLYSVSYYTQVTTVATTSSSLTPIFTWTSLGVVQTNTIAAITGNLTTTYGHGTFPMYCDADTTVKYAMTYASNVAAEMKYFLYIVLVRVNT